MKNNYDNAIRFILFYEKYKSNHPSDPGGITIWGISSRYYPKEVNTMLAMTAEGSKEYAKVFYRREFWDRIDGDNLPYGLDCVLMDIAVNQGISTAKAIEKACANWHDALILRCDRWDDSKNYGTFGKGWSKRNVSLRDYITSDFTILEWDKKELIPAKR